MNVDDDDNDDNDDDTVDADADVDVASRADADWTTNNGIEEPLQLSYVCRVGSSRR